MASSNSKRPANEPHKALIDQFCAITGGTAEEGERLLEACAGNLEMAIGMHMDGSNGIPATAAATNQQEAAAPDVNHMDIPPDDEVRAPIPQRQEILVEDHGFGPYHGRGRRRAAQSVFDGFRDFQAEARQQELESCPSTSRGTKRKTLEDLFRPPIDIMHKGSFHSARDTGSSMNKWLLINIQNVTEFACQMLNRDVWSNHSVKSLIKDHFCFWQVYHDSEEGRKFMQFYKVLDWPYIAILDPRTGENLMSWNKMDAATFCELVSDFLAEHPAPDGSTSSSPPKKKVKLTENIVDASEDSQLEAAIRASLEQPDTAASTSAPNKPSNDSSVFFEELSSDDEDDLETFSDSDEESEASPVKCRTSPTKRSASPPRGPPLAKSCKKKTGSAPQVSVDSCDKQNKSDTCKPSTVKSKDSGGDNVNKDNNHKVKSENKSNGSSTSSSSSSSTAETSSTVSWRYYLGPDTDSKCDIMIRFPDGNRKQLSVPCTTKLKALVLYVIEEGFTNERFELITTFPRRKLSYMEWDDTLQQIGLGRQETVFVQER